MKIIQIKNIFILSFFVITNYLFTQTVENGFATSNFLIKSYTTFEQDSIYIHNNENSNSIIGIHSETAYLNSNIRIADMFFKSTQPSLFNSNNQCNKILDTSLYGPIIVFKGTSLEVTDTFNIKGLNYLSFENPVTQQTFFRQTSTKDTSLVISSLQIANPKGVYIKNIPIKITNNLNLFQGKLYVDTKDLELLTNYTNNFLSAYTTCYNTINYIITKNNAFFVKGNLKNQNDIPIGTDNTLAMPKISFTPINILAATNMRIGFNLDTFTTNQTINNNIYRYDESLGLIWNLKNMDNITPDMATFDSIELLTPKSYITNRTKLTKNNFSIQEAFISKYVGTNNNSNGGELSYSPWDNIKYNSKLGVSLYTIPNDITNQLLVFKRKNNLNFTTNTISNFTITNLNNTPLTNIVNNFTAVMDSLNCNISAKWNISDMYYSGINFGLYFTNDTLQPRGVFKGDFLNFQNETILRNQNVLSANIMANSLSSNVNSKKPIYVSLYQRDEIGPEVNTNYTLIPVTCNSKLDPKDFANMPVTYLSVVGNKVILNIELSAIYDEYINISFYNLLGEQEHNFGSYLVNKGNNKLILKLPENIGKNQRYVLLIQGGILNKQLERIATSIFVP